MYNKPIGIIANGVFPMNKLQYDTYIKILEKELIPALGCTEPIALAYAAAKVKECLGEMPDKVNVKCSGNIIKNVKGVAVPNSGGLKGIEVSIILGILGGDASKGLEVLESITDENREEAKKLLKTDFCTCSLAEGIENLYILIEATKGKETASLEIKKEHLNITNITKNGKTIFTLDDSKNNGDEQIDKSLLNVKDILEFANTVNIDAVSSVIKKQIEMNSNIAIEGIENAYGVEVGRTLLEFYDKNDVRIKAAAMASAASDARMGGCSMPVVINSGSGNQGITASVPVIEYAKYLKIDEDKLIRSLVVSNLIAIHQKTLIGMLSAFCGVVSAATGSASAITYMHGGGYKEVSDTITNTLANVGGIICDGAKSSCAAKISSSVQAGILAFILSTKKNLVFQAGEGLVKDDVEKTIKSFCKVGRDGMKETDIEILNIMIDK